MIAGSNNGQKKPKVEKSGRATQRFLWILTLIINLYDFK